VALRNPSTWTSAASIRCLQAEGRSRRSHLATALIHHARSSRDGICAAAAGLEAAESSGVRNAGETQSSLGCHTFATTANPRATRRPKPSR